MSTANETTTAPTPVVTGAVANLQEREIATALVEAKYRRLLVIAESLDDAANGREKVMELFDKSTKAGDGVQLDSFRLGVCRSSTHSLRRELDKMIQAEVDYRLTPSAAEEIREAVRENIEYCRDRGVLCDGDIVSVRHTWDDDPVPAWVPFEDGVAEYDHVENTINPSLYYRVSLND